MLYELSKVIVFFVYLAAEAATDEG